MAGFIGVNLCLYFRGMVLIEVHNRAQKGVVDHCIKRFIPAFDTEDFDKALIAQLSYSSLKTQFASLVNFEAADDKIKLSKRKIENPMERERKDVRDKNYSFLKEKIFLIFKNFRRIFYFTKKEAEIENFYKET